jgi:hypothetical protein
MADTVSSSLAMCEPFAGQGFKVRMPTEYPFRSMVIFAAGVSVVGAGPLAALVSLSISNRLALEKLPRADTSTVTVKGTPGPLFSVAGLFTAYRVIGHHYNHTVASSKNFMTGHCIPKIDFSP